MAEIDALDRIRGSLIGGAAGDALGYTIEFMGEDTIFSKYGKEGITEYSLNMGVAVISDDTQMTLFTANGLLIGDTRGALAEEMSAPHVYVKRAYHDWYLTQTCTMKEVNKHHRYSEEGGVSWLLDIPELYKHRAPGNTCLSALQENPKTEDYITHPINNSKGCGGVMRVAPVGLFYNAGANGPVPIETLDMEGAYVAAITHGHDLGFMPAAVITHIVNRIVYPNGKQTLKEIVLEAKKVCQKLFKDFPSLEELNRCIDLAIELSENDADDLENIHKLGEGWVAEEAMAIAIYCALKYENDFSKGIIVAANHNGDSDSTAAICGNILGAICGYQAIEAQKKWTECLELRDVIIELANDLYRGCPMMAGSIEEDETWLRKYVEMRKA